MKLRQSFYYASALLLLAILGLASLANAKHPAKPIAGKTDQTYTSQTEGWACIYNTLGGKVAEANSAIPITISGLERGIYFIRASDAAGASQLIRLVKE